MRYAIKISIYHRFTGPLALAVLVALMAFGSMAMALEGQDTLTPSGKSPAKLSAGRAETIQRANISYKDCTAAATAAAKAGRIKPEELPAEFGRCTDKFPAAGLFQECKKNLLKSAKGSEISVADVAECKKILSRATFELEEPVPLFVAGAQAVFAGVGLNRSIHVPGTDIPNYNCLRLQNAFSNIPKNAQHILFGNHPRMFLKGPEQQKFLQVLQAAYAKGSKRSKYNDISGFGRLFGDPSKDQSIVYFPSSSCDFEGTTGQIFMGMSLYYLADVKNHMAAPYFGIAYYRQGQKSVTTPELVAEVSRRLGPDFKAYSKDVNTVFISSTPFKEVDRERDPRNICELPRQHRYVAVVRTVKGSPNVPEYLLLANIRNLCDHGDLQARSVAW